MEQIPSFPKEFPIGSHPTLFLQAILEHTQVEAFEFEAYEHRTLKGTLRHTLTNGGVEQARAAFTQLATAEELAVRSKVVVTKETGSPFQATIGSMFQVPMIDFAAPVMDDALAGRVARALGFVEAQPMYVYSSGQSFHGYVAALATEQQWVRFLGMMLLLNKLGQPDTVDVRWVGHKLKSGCATLRLTTNTKRHNALPSYVRRIDPVHIEHAGQDEDYC